MAVIQHEIRARPPLRIDWLFDAQPYGVDIVARVGAPVGYPPDLRKAQTVQMHAPDGTPLYRPNGRPLRLTYSEAMLELATNRDNLPPWAVAAYTSFTQAVRQACPCTLDEVVSTHGIDAVAAVLRIRAYSLRNRISGRVLVSMQEMLYLREAFPDIDIESTLLQLTARRSRLLEKGGRPD